MRAYFFGNFYLSSIQQGIQAQHCTAELFIKYCGFSPQKLQQNELEEWAHNHKTSILLNGGDCEALQGIVDLLNNGTNPSPWARFRESTGALNGATTCVGIILPEKMYSDEAKSYVRSESRRGLGDCIHYQYEIPKLSSWEFSLIKHMSKCGMAR